MPPIEHADLHQTALRYRKTGRDRRGRAVLAEPEEFAPGSPCGGVRWIATNASAMAPNNSEVTIDVVLTTKKDVNIGDLFWYGGFADLVGTADPDDLYEVVTEKKTPDIKARVCRFEYGLKKYGDTMPTPNE